MAKQIQTSQIRKSNRQRSSRWIDISVYIRNGMVHWPGDPPTSIRPIHDMRKGSEDNVSHLSLGTHTGTHMDAPHHFFERGRGIDTVPLDAVIGPARILDVRGQNVIHAEDLMSHNVKRGERILLRTSNSPRAWKTSSFDKDYVYLAPDGARYLASLPALVVGIDYLSVGGDGEEGAETHRALLRAGIWIIEGLNLSRLHPGHCELICLPLKIMGADGAPARAVIRYV